MRKLSGFHKDIITTIIVLVAVTVLLNAVSYQNHLKGSVASARQLNTQVLTKKSQTEQIYLFTTQDTATNIFPDFSAKVNWDKQAVIGYVGMPQSSPDYYLKLVDVKRDGNYININYKTTSATNPIPDISNISYPSLFVVINKTDLIAGSDLHIQFIEGESGHTKTLRLPPNEI